MINVSNDVLLMNIKNRLIRKRKLLQKRKNKIEYTERINRIVRGSVDDAGNIVVDVLAKQNEFAIYEIDTKDINKRIRVLIDGHTNESEKVIQNRFNLVKQKYIESKGLLAHASNFETMKQRVAHTLSTALNSDELDGKSEFDELINTIIKEHENLVRNRVIYILPALSLVLFMLVICLITMNYRFDNNPWWQISISLLAASLGGAISIVINTKKLNFEEFKTLKYYFILGVERVALACMAGAVSYIFLKSKILLPNAFSNDYWNVMLVIVVSGFSESLIPRFLSKKINLM